MNNTIKVVISANPIKEWAKEQTQEVIKGVLETIVEGLVEATYSIALIGGGLSILLWLGGWRDGKRWAGILFMAHILIKFLLGGI